MNAVPPGLAGALADRYLIEREVGAGGMATVYLARDLRHKRSVAIKVIRPGLAGGDGAPVPYFVMPYVEGETLRQRLERDGRLPVETAARLGDEVADALAYA